MVPPSDTVQRLGDSISLTCRAYVGYDVLEWREYVTDKTRGRSIYDTWSDVINDDRYDVITSDYRTFELVIKNVTEDVAGVYECGLLRANENVKVSVVAVCKSSNLHSILYFLKSRYIVTM